jgi:DNA-nicking Smr family endonuclease
MKKKKTHDKAPPDFKNNPFRSLKGFSPPAGGEKTSLPKRKKDEQHEDDSDLFLKAVAGARKMDNDEIASTGKGITEHAASHSAVEPQDRRIFLEAMQKIGTTFKDERTGEPEALEPERRSASSRMRQLKRGTIRVSQELDLHGFLRDEALKRLEQFIAGAFGRGQQAVLVISGKGINSPDGPVLQGAVSSWLRERGKRMVAEFAPAPRDMGGSGAFVVFLRKRDGR